MTTKFHALTDDDLAGRSCEDLIARYRALRDHHVAETEALTKRDRSAILRMAGNIAGGMLAGLSGSVPTNDIAFRAVGVARAIVVETDA